MIDPGQFRTPLTYQTPVSTIDSYGQPVTAWTDVVTFVALVRPLNGREVFYARQVHAETTHQVVCRYRTDFTPTGRFIVAGTNRVLNIVGLLDFEDRRIELTIPCVERTPSLDPPTT